MNAPTKPIEELATEFGLTVEELGTIRKRLNREPNLVELGVFSVMWSEHCSYKSSRIHLAKFPTDNEHVIQGPGENAGVIDIGDGQAAIFKMESHNHPSFIEPYQGAATGVGGILRDVFTMGARPVALLNALRFGAPDHSKTKRLVKGVVAGIGGYGNCVGVPTVAGEVNFDPGYNGNILVNAMAVGLADADKIFYSAAPGVGLKVMYFGSKTGRDGIHGATMASAEFDDASEEKRPTVQVGDPFTEKLLIEATLELMASGAVAAIQDMGAAGLTCSSVEMADKGDCGIEIDLDLVPQREDNMTAYEMMLSESQERMLVILKPGMEQTGLEIIQKWGLDAAVIGETTDSKHMVVKHQGEVVCDVPIRPLSDDAPKLDRPHAPTPARKAVIADEVSPPTDWNKNLIEIISYPNMASKRWVWTQYDRSVMNDTITTAGNAGLVRVHGTDKALAMTSDCTPRYCVAAPYEGGKQVVAEAWRNLTAVGATPIAITDNLNFGNPERPDVMGQFVGCIEGMAEACKALNFPVISGNVSLYNETNGVGIPPTPVVGGVGVLANLEDRASVLGLRGGDVLMVIGETHGHLGASLYMQIQKGQTFATVEGAPPPVDLTVEKRNGDFVRQLIAEGHTRTVTDLSDGGLAAAACDLALANDVGLRLAPAPIAAHGWLYGEDQGRYLLALRPDAAQAVLALATEAGVPAEIVGEAGGDRLTAAGAFDLPLAEVKAAYENWMPEYMK